LNLLSLFKKNRPVYPVPSVKGVGQVIGVPDFIHKVNRGRGKGISYKVQSLRLISFVES